VPQGEEVLVRVAASGLNRADLSQIAGRYPPPLGESDILGLEVSGTIDGSDHRVCALLAGGGHAEYVAAPQGQVFPAPPQLDLVAAAGIPEAFLTTFANLVVEGGLAPGALAVLAPGGRIICIATMGGRGPPLDLSLLMRKRARLIGSVLRARSRAEKAALVRRFCGEILPAFQTGALRVMVDSVLPPTR